MTTGPILGPLVAFSLPIMLTGILQLLFNAADIIVVGQFVDETAVAAVGACTSLIQLTISLFIGISLGATVTLANYLGAGRQGEIPSVVHTAYTLGVLCGVGAGAVCVACTGLFLGWMRTPADVIGQAEVYLRIYFAGTPGFLIYTFGSAILIPTGDTRRPLYYLSAAGVLNVALNLFLVIVCHLGVAGVAIATIISQALSAVLITRALVRLPGEFRLSLRGLYIDGRQARRIIALGLPAGLQSAVFSISNVIIQSAVNVLGTLYVAGNSAASSIEAFVYTSMNAVSQGCMTFGGQNLGAREYGRLSRIYRLGLLCVTVLGAGMGLAVCLGGKFLLGIYLPTSPEAVDYGMVRISILVTTIALCGLMDCTTGMLRGMNRSLFPMIATVVGSCAMRVAWVFTVFRWFLNAGSDSAAYKALLVSYPISWALTFGALLVYYTAVCRALAREERPGAERESASPAAGT